MGDTAKMLDATQEGIGEIVRDGYDAAIDFGAHPNMRGVFGHLHTSEDDDQFMVSLVGLYSPGASEIDRMLMASLDYGLAIAIVLAHCLQVWPRGVQEGLEILNDTKERLAQEYFVA